MSDLNRRIGNGHQPGGIIIILAAMKQQLHLPKMLAFIQLTGILIEACQLLSSPNTHPVPGYANPWQLKVCH